MTGRISPIALSLVLLVAMSLTTLGCGKRGPLSLSYDTDRMERG